MDDLISRQAAIDDILRRFDTLKMTEFGTRTFRDGVADGYARIISDLKSLPPAQPELCEDAVSRQRLLSDLKELVAAWKKYPVMAEQIKGVEAAIGYVELIPSVKPNSKELSETHKALDIISRQAAIDAINKAFERVFAWDGTSPLGDKVLENVPSAQPEIIRCKDCRYYQDNNDGYPHINCKWDANETPDADDFCSGAERRTDG